MGTGGTELNAIRVAELLDPRRIELRVVCLGAEGPLSERYANAGIPIHYHPLSSLYRPSALRQGLRLASFLRKWRADVFHAHDVYSNIFGLPWARLAMTPGVFGSRRWWLGPHGRLHQAANRWAYRFADNVVVNAPGLTALLSGREGVAKKRIVSIPNFVEADAFKRLTPGEGTEWRRRVGLPADQPVVGIVANLRPEKDHITLLRASRKLLSEGLRFHIAIVGDGSERPQLQEIASDFGLNDAVTFTGHLPNRPNLHQLFDVTVLCSLTEAFPNTLLEAMAAGRAVVATEVGGVPDLVTHGKTGLLFSPQSSSELAGALQKLLPDLDLRQQYGIAGRREAEVRYSAAKVLPLWHELYESREPTHDMAHK